MDSDKQPRISGSVVVGCICFSFHGFCKQGYGVVAHSLACGVPVVATNVCDNSYVVKDGETGFLVELGDVEGMAGRIQTLLENETLRRKMRQKARDWVLQKFSIKQLVRKTESVYLKKLELVSKLRKSCLLAHLTRIFLKSVSADRTEEI